MGNADVRILGKRLMVRVEQPKTQSEGGIYIPPKAAAELKDRGLVVLVGEECQSVKVGEVVYFVPFMAQQLEISGKPYYVVEEEHVIAAYTPAELGEDQCQTQTQTKM